MASHLSNGPVNLGVLRESYRRELLECLDKCTGSKALVWDDNLTGPIGLIAEYSLLKEHEVDKMFPLRPGRLQPSNVQNIIFICRPNLALMENIAQNVLKEEEMGGFRKDFHLFFVPRKSFLCEKALKDLGVYGTFTNVDEFCLDLIPFDGDVLSMEMDLSYRDCVLNDDWTSLYHAAKALMTLQALYGIIPNIQGKGPCAKHVVEMMLRMRREMAGQEPQIMAQIDHLLIIDRSTDPLTPLLSQLTYEGLIDEIFGINNTTVKLPGEKFAPQGKGGDEAAENITTTEPKKFILNSTEELFAELRDRNFNAVGPLLSRKAKLIAAQFDERHSAKTVGEIKQFVSKLPHMQAAKTSLATHTSIAELVKEETTKEEFMASLRAQQEFYGGMETDKAHPYIEDCIAKLEPLVKVLRLICIQCICNNGFKPKMLEFYKREILQTYGFEHLITLHNLEKAGLLKIQGARTYPTLRKTLKLIVEEVNEQNPNDISYVYSGYAPLSVRLAQIAHRPGWRSIHEALNLLPGPTIDEIQQIPMELRRRSQTGEQKVTLVFFLGGVTHAEIAALRFLSHQEDSPSEYIVATTKLITGDSWLKSIAENLSAKSYNPF
ncbi:hypothetical protein CAPTEDRAFT_101629 [Capitella teleta]|uniref:Vacuolar protein sorting-associated protein 33A n=1 Tax=Capitella teleta TaxID=283909 RepID=R7T769_CAPTE|nr:hypothetical protein CAPTEDRAFT_101629 [Capitella teleta]|eukprot:ELT89435.1 hypothetical protein CAPTEDRAFT_101629 [Capitella teleta]